MNELMKVTQLPVIQEQLRSMKESVDERVNAATSLICTADTVQTVKTIRAALNKEFSELEAQRKSIKDSIMKPYLDFDAVYQDCISNAYKAADTALKGKIEATENEIKGRCEAELRGYFSELTATAHLEWLKYEQAGLKIGMTEAKQKTLKKPKDYLCDFVQRVRSDVDAIEKADDADAVMVEYRQTLNLALAISTVQERRRRIAEAREEAMRRAEICAKEAAAAAKVDESLAALRPPEEVKAIEAAKKQVLKCVFTVRGTKEQLIRLREYMKQEGISYEH